MSDVIDVKIRWNEKKMENGNSFDPLLPPRIKEHTHQTNLEKITTHSFYMDVGRF